MSDIVEDLKDSISVPAGADVNYSVPRWKIENAIKEIEHLRSFVGAVSQGQSAAEIKASIKTGAQGQSYDSNKQVDYRKLFHCLETMTPTSHLDKNWCAEYASALGVMVTEPESPTPRDPNG